MTTPLVYPRTLPSDVLGSRREISREDTFATKLVDYLKIQVYDPQQGGNPYTYVGNDGKPVAEPFRNASDAGLVGNCLLYTSDAADE